MLLEVCAKLRRTQVVREMAKSLEALVQGELMQLKSSEEERLSLEYYLTKSYCKTASLMAYSCKSAALLSDHALDSEVVIAAEKFGYHFGLAFQVSVGPHTPSLRPEPSRLTPRRGQPTGRRARQASKLRRRVAADYRRSS